MKTLVFMENRCHSLVLGHLESDGYTLVRSPVHLRANTVMYNIDNTALTFRLNLKSPSDIMHVFGVQEKKQNTVPREN